MQQLMLLLKQGRKEMSKIRDAIIHMPETGMCDIDVDRIIELFNINVAVCQWKDTYKLVEENGVKIAIRKEDALRLIRKCCLQPVPSPIFKSSTTWIQHPLL